MLNGSLIITIIFLFMLNKKIYGTPTFYHVQKSRMPDTIARMILEVCICQIILLLALQEVREVLSMQERVFVRISMR